MKRFILVSLLAALSYAAYADIQGAKIDNVRLERNGDYMVVDMDIDLQPMKVKSNRALIITPAIANGGDSLNFSSVGVYGRKRYFYYVRDGRSNVTGATERSFRRAKRPDTLVYRSIIPYQEWMEGSYLVLNHTLYGCCNAKVDQQSERMLNQYFTPQPVTEKIYYMPTFVYIKPEAEGVKTREIKGSAFVDFPVNQIVIYPEYRNNTSELRSILATIEQVKDNSDVSITALSIKGYASPEGTYQHNTYLARERTAALMRYVQKLVHLDPKIVSTSYEPEDWEGLREYVESSNLPNRAAILALIDSGREPDNKEWKLKSTYPADYQHLLKNIYPALRHSDYVVEYTVRSYTDIEEIKRVLATAPQNLSLEELYLVANSYESGSDEHHEVFEVAVRMFPEDEIANLNAANSAMQKRDLTAAARYLKRAGNSAEAIYARGAYAALEEDYDTARYLFRQSVKAGLAQGQIAIDEINAFVASINESKPNKTK